MQSRLIISGDIGGVGLNGTIQRSADGNVGRDPTLAAAKAGSLTTRTNNTDGQITAVSHGLVQSDIVDLYWSGGRRYNAVVGVVAGDVVPITGGAGDNLPVQGTAVTLMQQVTVDVDFAGDELQAIGAVCPALGHLGFYDGATLRLSVDLAAGEPWFWVAGNGLTNPLATYTITHVVVTHADSASAQTVKLGVLEDATP